MSKDDNKTKAIQKQGDGGVDQLLYCRVRSVLRGTSPLCSSEPVLSIFSAAFHFDHDLERVVEYVKVFDSSRTSSRHPSLQVSQRPRLRRSSTFLAGIANPLSDLRMARLVYYTNRKHGHADHMISYIQEVLYPTAASSSARSS